LQRRSKQSLEVVIMKSLIQAVAIAAILAGPAAAFAQAADTTQQPLTRAEVRSQLVQLEKAGYNPSRAGRDPYYPEDIQAAEARVAAQNGSTSGVGGAVSGSSGSGAN
jgi:hypothetical protein